MGRQLSRTFAALIVAAAAVGGAQVARGEVFVLKAGGRIEGEHLNPQRTAAQPYQVRTEDGLVLELAANTVARVVIKSDVQREYEARLPGVPQTVDGHWAMAEWCQEAGLDEQRRRHLVSVIGLDPDHAEARRLLGYTRYGSKWMTQDEFLQSRGYVRTKGVWRLQQEIDLEVQRRDRERAEKELTASTRMWFEQVANGGRNAANAERRLNELRDPNAAPALVDIIGDRRQPRSMRLRCMEILGRLPPGMATATLVRVALEDQDETIRDRCLDELVRGGTHLCVAGFVAELRNKSNARVLRAASCLQRLGDKEAVLPLIDALVTEHTFVEQQSSPPGALGAGFGTGPGTAGAGGMGTFGVGGKPKSVKKSLNNDAVHSALRSLCPAGVDYQFDTAAWKRWYIQTFTTSNVNMRRDE